MDTPLRSAKGPVPERAGFLSARNRVAKRAAVSLMTLRFLFGFVSFFMLLAGMTVAQRPPSIHYNGQPTHPAFELRGWDGASTSSASEASSRERWQPVFSVYVDQTASEVPPLAGSYRLEGAALVFEPRYPLQPGLRYRAIFRPLGESTPAPEALAKTFEIPNPNAGPVTSVEQVYPTTDRLPENQLKFYIRFTAAMSRGEAYERVSLLNAADEPISLPFLELEQELWDPEGRRLTLLFDPGRVKRDLLPNREVGSPLREGERYTLVVDREWRDAAGRPLTQGFRKEFEVGPPDHDPPSIVTWQITPPKAATRDPLVVGFPEPMDEALAVRVIEVKTGVGRGIAGSIQVDQHETRWQFRPDEPWASGDYVIDVATLLEDLAGNSLERPFEVDVFEKVEERVSRVSRIVRFTVAP